MSSFANPDVKEVISSPSYGMTNRAALVRQFLARPQGHPLVIQVKAHSGWGKSYLLQQCQDQAADWGWTAVLIDLGGIADRAQLVRALQQELEALDIACASDQTICDSIDKAGQRTLILLDSIDQMENSEVAEYLQDIIGSLAVMNAVVVIATRERVELSLARWLVQGRIVTIGPEAMSLSLGEIETLLFASGHADWATSALVQTGGWPFAVAHVAAALAEATSSHWTSFSQCIAAIMPDIAAVVHEEIMSGISDDGRAYLFDVAVLGRLPAGTCHIATLGALYPLVTVAQSGGGVAMTPVFREALLFLRMQSPTMRPAMDVLLDAARSLHDENRSVEAIGMARVAGRPDLMLEWFRESGGCEIGLKQGVNALRRVIEQFSVAQIDESPDLLFARTLLFMKEGSPELARLALSQIQHLLEDKSQKPSPLMDYHRAIVEGLLSIYEDTPAPDAIANLERALTSTPVASLWSRGYVENLLCVSYFNLGDMERAFESGVKALQVFSASRTYYSQIYMHLHLAMISDVRGEPVACAEHVALATDLCAEHFKSDPALSVLPQTLAVMLAFDNREISELSTPIGDILDALEQNEGWVAMFSRAYTTAAAMALEQGGTKAALSILARGRIAARRRDLPRLESMLEALGIELESRTADSAKLQIYLDRARSQVADPALGFEEQYQWVWALAVASHYSGEAKGAVEPLKHACQLIKVAGHFGFGVRTMILLALALEDDLPEECDAWFERALGAAGGFGTTRGLLDDGQDVPALAQRYLKRNSITQLSRDATAALGRLFAETAPRSPGGTSSGLLSNREQTVLLQISEGASNKHIARALDLSEATVKFHVRNIFDKLGVRTRVLAIEVARQKGLLPDTESGT